MLLFADIFETVIGPLLFILWIAAQLLGSRKEAKQKKKAPRPQPQPMGMAEGAPRLRMQGPRNQEEALRSEVEDFLRRAQGKPPKPQPTLEPVAKRLTQSLQPKPSRPKLQQAKPQQKRPAAPAEIRTLRSEGVAEHVARHLSTQDIAEHTKTLGADVALADDRLESRLHEKFDHQLGALQHRDSPAEAKPQKDDMAADIAAMLRSPQGMRQLIVASEILRRPEW